MPKHQAEFGAGFPDMEPNSRLDFRLALVDTHWGCGTSPVWDFQGCSWGISVDFPSGESRGCCYNRGSLSADSSGLSSASLGISMKTGMAS